MEKIIMTEIIIIDVDIISITCQFDEFYIFYWRE